MGAALWLAAGLAAFVVARVIPQRRPATVVWELLFAIATALVLGILATALDFGGWKEPDWRSIAFAFFGGAAAIGMMRVLPR